VRESSCEQICGAVRGTIRLERKCQALAEALWEEDYETDHAEKYYPSNKVVESKEQLELRRVPQRDLNHASTIDSSAAFSILCKLGTLLRTRMQSVQSFRGAYAGLLILRACFAIFGTGYIHPDEYFQNGEVTAGMLHLQSFYRRHKF